MILGTTRRRREDHNDTTVNHNVTQTNTSTTASSTPTTTTPTQQTQHNDTDTDSDAHDADSDASEPHETPDVDDDDNLEPWVDWIRRCTHDAEAQMKALGLEDWVTTQRRRKWRWARRVATDTLGKWTLKALNWDPLLDSRYNPRRRAGRPLTRWVDDITEYITTRRDQQLANNHWMNIAATSTVWNALEKDFVSRTDEHISIRS